MTHAGWRGRWGQFNIFPEGARVLYGFPPHPVKPAGCSRLRALPSLGLSSWHAAAVSPGSLQGAAAPWCGEQRGAAGFRERPGAAKNCGCKGARRGESPISWGLSPRGTRRRGCAVPLPPVAARLGCFSFPRWLFLSFSLRSLFWPGF